MELTRWTLSQTPSHIHYSGFTYSQIRPLTELMLECCDVPQRHHLSIFEKYADKKFKNASKFVQTQLDLGFILPEVWADLAAQRTRECSPSEMLASANEAVLAGLS